MRLVRAGCVGHVVRATWRRWACCEGVKNEGKTKRPGWGGVGFCFLKYVFNIQKQCTNT